MRLLSKARERFPGDLKKGERRNFTEPPDNFWTVEVQPRVGNFLVHVRGEPSHFTGSRLKLLRSRSRYTRFYIEGVDEADAAFDLIVRAPKKDPFR